MAVLLILILTIGTLLLVVTHDTTALSNDQKMNLVYGYKNIAMVCPHCANTICVRTKKINRKSGISGGKATGAILTGGLSLLATGLSKQEKVTQCHCDKCNNIWIL